MQKVHPVQIACALRACVRYLDKSGDYDRQTIDNNEFVCWALDTTVSKGLCSEETVAAAKHMIEQRLKPYNHVEAWLASKGHLSYNDTTVRQRFNLVQDYRHLWVESMAKEHFAMAPSICDEQG
jgi:hypothetical protein